MTRILILIAGLFGAALLIRDAMQHTLSPHLFSDKGVELFLAWGYQAFALLLFLRLPRILFLGYSWFESLRWRFYLGATEVRPIWTDDLNPDAY